LPIYITTYQHIPNVKRILVEQTVIFVSICKWCVLAAVVGIIVGLSTTVFLKALNYGIALPHQLFYYCSNRSFISKHVGTPAYSTTEEIADFCLIFGLLSV